MGWTDGEGWLLGGAAFALLSGWSGKHYVASIGRLRQHHSHDFSSREILADLHWVDFAAGVLPRPARDQTISASHSYARAPPSDLDRSPCYRQHTTSKRVSKHACMRRYLGRSQHHIQGITR